MFALIPLSFLTLLMGVTNEAIRVSLVLTVTMNM